VLRVEAQHSASPEEVVQSVNRHLLDRNSTEFVSLLYGVLYCRTADFSYVRAGHELPMISNGHLVRAMPMGRSLPLGLFEDLSLDSQTVRLPPESTLLLYTDGVTEAYNIRDGMFGESRLQEILHGNSPNDSSQALCDRILETVVAYHGASAMSDDVTVVAVRAGVR
jgi:phosphoserine phosphatase RsbU/P